MKRGEARRYWNLNAKCIPMADGEDPPSDRLDKDYVMQPRNVRRCKKCNKWHDLVIENSYTGERIEEIDECKECFVSGGFK